MAWVPVHVPSSGVVAVRHHSNSAEPADQPLVVVSLDRREYRFHHLVPRAISRDGIWGGVGDPGRHWHDHSYLGSDAGRMETAGRNLLRIFLRPVGGSGRIAIGVIAR